VRALTLVAELVVQTSVITIVPTALYVGFFYLHLAILTKAGVHDALMTSAFQVRILF
jgi:dolichyl-phosphate-mannose-protein mannosyltransferase